jgi:hypothetical protein
MKSKRFSENGALKMNRRVRAKIAGTLLTLATALSLVSLSAYSDTQGSDRREGRRDDRGGARDTRQTGRDDARDTKDACKDAGDSRPECRKGKRDVKQDARGAARDVKRKD